MFTGRLVFAQVMDFMPLPVFRSCVVKYRGDYRVRKFTCLDQFLSMTKQATPVIEVGAAKKITVIISEGKGLEIRMIEGEPF